jgi:hypothetical protein
VDINLLLEQLENKDHTVAYSALKKLLALSDNSDELYCYYPLFSALLTSSNSYVRTRGFILIAANAQWDSENKIENDIDKIFFSLSGEKPLEVRQCIKALAQIGKSKPSLRKTIIRALSTVDTTKFSSSLAPLLKKELEEAFKLIG